MEDKQSYESRLKLEKELSQMTRAERRRYWKQIVKEQKREMRSQRRSFKH